MGGYGGSSNRVKDKCYYDTGNHKVTDANAIAVAEKYINEGQYVAFLQEKPGQPRADLSVEGVHVEVKGLSSLNPDNIEGKIKHAFEQINADNYRYPSDTHREGKLVILSKHAAGVSRDDIITAMRKGFDSANHKGYAKGKVEVWIGSDIIFLN